MQYVAFFGRLIYNLANIKAGKFSCCATHQNQAAQIGNRETFMHADFMHWVTARIIYLIKVNNKLEFTGVIR
jgi:hypothetical protein